VKEGEGGGRREEGGGRREEGGGRREEKETMCWISWRRKERASRSSKGG
jgi:hypothetical protein